MDWYKVLTDIGLVRVRLKDKPVDREACEIGPGTVWWVGKRTAEELVCSGKATLVPRAEREGERDE